MFKSDTDRKCVGSIKNKGNVFKSKISWSCRPYRKKEGASHRWSQDIDNELLNTKEQSSI